MIIDVRPFKNVPLLQLKDSKAKTTENAKLTTLTKRPPDRGIGGLCRIFALSVPRQSQISAVRSLDGLLTLVLGNGTVIQVLQESGEGGGRGGERESEAGERKYNET